MIPQAYETAIIRSGLDFMRSITEAYGPEEGLQLWTTIADTLDPNIKAKIFFAMITGEYNNQIVVRGAPGPNNKIPVIKTIRAYDVRKQGLKEAKDLADELYSGRSIKLEVLPSNRARAIHELQGIGCLI